MFDLLNIEDINEVFSAPVEEVRASAKSVVARARAGEIEYTDDVRDALEAAAKAVQLARTEVELNTPIVPTAPVNQPISKRGPHMVAKALSELVKAGGNTKAIVATTDSTDGAPFGAPAVNDVSSMLTELDLGFVLDPRQQLSLLDLIPFTDTTSQTIGYSDRVYGAAAKYLAEQSSDGEFDFKAPDATFETSKQVVHVRRIAVKITESWLTATTTPGLSEMIRADLADDVRREIQNDVINSDGSGLTPKGILQLANEGKIATINVTEDISPLDAIELGKGAVEAAEYEATEIVLNRATLSTLVQTKDAEGRYIVSNTDNPTFWGLRPVICNALPSRHIVVGSVSRAARGFSLVGPDAKIEAYRGETDMEEGTFTTLAEAYVAVTILRPSALALVVLPDPEA